MFYNPTDEEILREISKLAEQIHKDKPNQSDLDNWLQAEKHFWSNISYYQKLSESFIEKHKDLVNWLNISQYQNLSESFIEKHKDLVNWLNISQYQNLSESFIEKHKDLVNWLNISYYQKLSESFIKVDWYWISECQKLSEPFIERNKNKVDWYQISAYQKLSESFIERNKDLVNWINISINQKLSEPFIEEHKDLVHWLYISYYQKLSESFIERNKDLVNWINISINQKLSEEFRQKHNIKIPKNNWLYTSKQDKINYIKENTKYEVINDEYILAYKSTRYEGYSVYNYQYKYEVGQVYESHCDCNLEHEDSFGLSAWTKEKALEYYNKGELYLVKILIDDIGAIVHKGNKIRAFKIEVLEKIQ